MGKGKSLALRVAEGLRSVGMTVDSSPLLMYFSFCNHQKKEAVRRLSQGSGRRAVSGRVPEGFMHSDLPRTRRDGPGRERIFKSKYVLDKRGR